MCNSVENGPVESGLHLYNLKYFEAFESLLLKNALFFTFLNLCIKCHPTVPDHYYGDPMGTLTVLTSKYKKSALSM